MNTDIEKITVEAVVNVWREVFPNSKIYPSKGCLGGGVFFKGKLSSDKSEVSNGILENDPLHYVFIIEEGNYREHSQHIYIRPSSKYYAYDSVKLRKKNIKDITLEKLKRRFEQIKDMIVENKENFINLEFDINSKI